MKTIYLTAEYTESANRRTGSGAKVPMQNYSVFSVIRSQKNNNVQDENNIFDR